MNHAEYRHLHSLSRTLTRFATECHELGVCFAETPNHPAARGMLAWFNSRKSEFHAALPTVQDRPAGHRLPLRKIPSDHRRRMLSAAHLRRCGVSPRVQPLPLP